MCLVTDPFVHPTSGSAGGIPCVYSMKTTLHMERSLLSISAITIAIATNAQLAPTTEARLTDHLLEVNAQWRVMDAAPAGGEHVVHFTNEAERIATHLHMVAAHARTRTPEGLSAAALAERAVLLEKLDAYADRGIFPQNHVLPYRNPIFIDPHGTACAVGQLMVESGNRALAERISADMNPGYVHDILNDDRFKEPVAQWAEEHGFTADELAWIQPGYPPNIPWYTVGSGTDSTVKELVRLQNGDLLTAGEFLTAGGTPAARVARWDGSAWHALGSGVLGHVSAAIEFNGSIMLGGIFGNNDLATWNGSTWTYSTAFESKQPEVTALHAHEGTLYAAGSVSGFAGTNYEVKRLVNGNWEQVGQSLNGYIRALESFDGALVCGGDFLGIPFEEDTTLYHVARLNNGMWTQLADGLNGNVHTLLAHQGQLYAGGDCVGALGAEWFGLARIAAGSVAWEPLMPNISNYIYWVGNDFTPPAHINALLADPDGTRIHLGGDFMVSEGMMVMGSGLATFHGTPDAVSVLGEFSGSVEDLELLGATELVAGGTSFPLAHIASTDLTLGLPQNTTHTPVRAWPNPVMDILRVELPTSVKITGIEVMDAAGRVVLRPASTGWTNTLDVRELATGKYTARIRTDKETLSVPFIKR